ncbi:MAG: DUF348 domain-containing protein [Chloroflexi bacterium]|nr:DUF348 domain-containing protein [Chloroflexota bacterium]
METTTDFSSDSLHLLRNLGAFAALALIVGALATGYQMTLTPVTLVIDGQEWLLRTHQDTVGALLLDSGLTFHPEDRVFPSELDTPLEPASIVRVERARPVIVNADGHTLLFRTHATSVEAALIEARVSVGPYDEVAVEGEFSPVSRPDGLSRLALATTAPEPVRITIHRAVPFTLHEDGQATTLYTTASTVGEALRRAGLTLYLADGVAPGLGERMAAGLRVQVDRSVPVVVEVDGRTLRTRTHRERVDEVLADLNVVLAGQDYTIPALDAPLGENDTVRVVRVSERFLVRQDPIPFEVAWQPDPDLEIDNQRLLQEGARGILEQRIRIRYEDGHEISRAVENEYVAVPPTTKIMGYGTKIVVRTLATPTGPVEYWRVIRMHATSYSAATAGTSPSSPWYGRTRTGEKMRFGIVAVDTRVIELRSNVYVPGYGVGYAGDTGGAIGGRRIDLGYDDNNLVLWYRWVEVYLLTPVPPPGQINYILGP